MQNLEVNELIAKLKSEITECFLEKVFKYFKEEVNSCYFIGSLAHGGFSRSCSDIDIVLILNYYSDSVVEKINNLTVESRLLDLAVPSERISIFWSAMTCINSTNSLGRLPEIDKLDLIRNGKIFYGSDIRSQLNLPLKNSILIDSCQFALLQLFENQQHFNFIGNPQMLIDNIRLLTKLVLFPVRFIYTADTGEVAVAEKAVDHLAMKEEVDKNIINIAQEALLLRGNGTNQISKANLMLIQKNMVPLYNIYIQKYREIMFTYNRLDLSSGLEKWQIALNAYHSKQLVN